MNGIRRMGSVAAIGCLLILVTGSLLTTVEDGTVRSALIGLSVIGALVAIGSGIVLLRDAFGQ